VQRRVGYILPGVFTVVATICAAVLIGMPAQAAPGKAVACSTTASQLDVNGDGYDDAVVGNLYATVNGKAEAGSITVLFGDADCRIGEGNRLVLTQNSVPDPSPKPATTSVGRYRSATSTVSGPPTSWSARQVRTGKATSTPASPTSSRSAPTTVAR